MDDRTKAKIAILALAGVFLIGFLTNKCDSDTCGSRRVQTGEAFVRLFQKNSIKKIVIRRARGSFELGRDSVVIDDVETLEEIRYLINDRKPFQWQKYSDLWEIHLMLTLDNGTPLHLKLEKFDSKEENDNSYRIYEDCDSSFESGGMDLANRILDIIRERKTNH